MGWDEWKARRERREKIERLQSNIEGLNEAIRRLQEIKRSYQTYNMQLVNAMQDWERQYESYNGIDLAQEIKVTDSYEGICADQMALDVPPIIERINNVKNQMASVSVGVYDQMTKIEDYIEVLQQQKMGFLTQLNALLGA